MTDIEAIGISIVKNLNENKELINQLSVEQFTAPLEVFSQSSLGQHFRHVIEFYTCLLSQEENGVICYDERNRDQQIEKDPAFALSSIESIISKVAALKENRRLRIRLNLSDGKHISTMAETSLYRELVYNLEHSIHHQALIKIGLLQFPEIKKVHDNFGVAPSTLRNRAAQSNRR